MARPVGEAHGTLDASGRWTQSVPIGKYEATVKIDGQLATAQIDMSQIGNTANWFCEVKPNETCTIQLRAK